MSAPVWEEVIGPRPDFERDRWGRPRILQPDGKRIAYTRCTTYVGAPEDMWNVQRWEKRQVALGLSMRDDLLLAVAAHREDKKELDRLVDAAKEAAAASAAATRGTAIHALTELVDQGRPLPTLPPAVQQSLDAYAEATRDFKALAIEQHLVQDPLGVAGTCDRILRYQGQRYIADLKTGSTVELGTGKIAAQLAMYARSRPYDVTTDQRGEAHGASVEWGLVIHLPAERPGEVNLHWFDLAAGWEWVKCARDVREQRKRKFADWTRPFRAGTTPEKEVKTERAAEAQLEREKAEAPDLRSVINAADSPEQVRAIWREHKAEWTPELTAFAAERIAHFGGAA